MEDHALEALKARVTGGDLDPGLLRQLADALDAQTTKERRRLLRTGGRGAGAARRRAGALPGLGLRWRRFS